MKKSPLSGSSGLDVCCQAGLDDGDVADACAVEDHPVGWTQPVHGVEAEDEAAHPRQRV